MNGWLTEEVCLKSGVRQGCPISPVMFVFVIDTLLTILVKDKCINAVEIPGSGGR